MIELKSYGMNCHQGPYLNLNEDLVEVDLVNNLFMVIDGFGGSNIGDRAALMIRDSLKRNYTKIASDPEATLPFFYSYKYIIEGNALINALHTAHKNVTKDNETRSLDTRGGGSVICGALSENILTLISSGNCQAYLYRKGHLSIEMLADSMNSLSRDRSSNFFQTAPMSGIGLFEDLHFQVREIKLAQGDAVLLLSDGIYARVDLDEIKYSIESHQNSELDAINELMKISNDRGNLDNQSGLLIRF